MASGQIVHTDVSREGHVNSGVHTHATTNSLEEHGYPVNATTSSTIVGDTEVFNFFADCTTTEVDNEHRMREFIVVEKILGEEGKDKTYSFKAPRDSEVNIKFTKVAKASELSTANSSLVSESISKGSVYNPNATTYTHTEQTVTTTTMGESVNDPSRLAEIFKNQSAGVSSEVIVEKETIKFGQPIADQFASSTTAAQL